MFHDGSSWKIEIWRLSLDGYMDYFVKSFMTIVTEDGLCEGNVTGEIQFV